MEARIDIGSLRPAQRTTEGFVIADAFISRSGVFEYEYIDADGHFAIRREWRPPGEVFAKESLDSFAMKPLTNNHPPVQVNADNANKYTAGWLDSTVGRDDDHVRTKICFADSEAIAAMEDGKLQLSCGYTCDVTMEPGVTPDGIAYDAVQKNIRGNHVALVWMGRAGDTVRTRLDNAFRQDHAVTARAAMVSATPVTRADSRTSSPPPPKTVSPKRIPMTTQNNDELNLRLETLTKELGLAKQRADASDSKLAGEIARADRAEGALSAARERIGELEKNQTDQAHIDGLNGTIRRLTGQIATLDRQVADAADPKKLDEKVRSRVSLEKSADQVLSLLGHKMVFDGIPDKEIMLAVCDRLGTPVDPAKSDDYIRAKYDERITGFKISTEEFGQLQIARDPNPGQRADAQSEHAKMVQRQRDAWKNPQQPQ